MGRLFRGLVRVVAGFFIGATLFVIGSAVYAALARQRIATTGDTTSNEPVIASVFAGDRFVSRAPALRGGRIITWFAGHDVDLRGATLGPHGATLQLRAMYGGTQIAIPEGWRVRSHVVSILGGTEIAVADPGLPADAPLLELRGFNLFGGIRVTTKPTESWSGADRDGEALPPAVDTTTTADETPSSGQASVPG
jgi:hypothetical protein